MIGLSGDVFPSPQLEQPGWGSGVPGGGWTEGGVDCDGSDGTGGGGDVGGGCGEGGGAGVDGESTGGGFANFSLF